MKITRSDFNRLQLDCVAFLNTHNIPVSAITNTRDAWLVFNHAKAYWLYNAGLDDSHIETALKRIFKI